MNNNDNSNLALEEIIATGAVFLLAGWFLWHHFSKQENTIQIVPSVSQSDRTRIWHIDENQQTTSRKYTEKSSVSAPESPRYTVTMPSQTIQTTSLASRSRQYDLDMTGLYSQDSVRPPETQQIPTDQLASKSKQLVNRSITSNSLQNTRQQSATTIPDKTQQAVVALSQRTDMEQPGQVNVTPTIQQPISTDLTGALKLKGNATPNSHILLLLNGRKVTSVQVTPTGQWSYETYLIPGEYSVQVKNDQNLKRSKSYQIVISKPQIQWSNPESKPKTTRPATVISNTAKMSTRSSKNRLYRVKPGDTLYTLSKRYAVTVSEITKANHISDKDQISVGQMLKIPKR